MPAAVVRGLHTGVVRRLPAAVDWGRMLHRQQGLIVAAQPSHLPLHAAVPHTANAAAACAQKEEFSLGHPTPCRKLQEATSYTCNRHLAKTTSKSEMFGPSGVDSPLRKGLSREAKKVTQNLWNSWGDDLGHQRLKSP